jgi:ribosomal protein S12 methylthiotransferase
MYIHDEFAPRLNSWSACSAYLKISEGCDHTCAFCIIPTLRGRLRSRSIPSLVAEATRLVGEGVREINLISQDSTAYGRDLKDGSDLGALTRALAAIDGLRWIRLHYAYPHGIPASFLRAMAEEPKMVPYIDIPLQHASGRMLKSMRRGVTREGQDRILARLREFVPDVTLRTTFIVGFPGETDEDFAELCDFVRAQRFDHVGVFTYFQEEGTPAAELPDQVDDEVKKERQDALMKLQASVSRDRLQKLVGTEVEVMIEGLSAESELLLRGRTARQAPDVDGQVYIINAPPGVRVGEFRRLRVQQAADYDLVGELVSG